MKKRLWAERLTLAIVTLLTLVGLVGVPSWKTFLTDPCLWAVASGIVTVSLMFITRRLGRRALTFEILWAAGFMAGMPLIYMARVFGMGTTAASGVWPWVEVAALPGFVALAYLGLRKSFWFLIAGTFLHGVVWDAWHYFHTDYIPVWYVTSCLLQDVGLALYWATRIPSWRLAGLLTFPEVCHIRG